MRSARLLQVLVVACVACAVSVRAYELDDISLSAWVGSGPHTALFVVDFWPGNDAADSFAFACSFETEELTGLQLMDALVAANIGFSYTDAGGGYITRIAYHDGAVLREAVENWPASWLSYWVSADHGENWEFAPVGPAQRILHDGDTDARLALPGDDFTSQPVTPLVELMPGDLNCDGLFTFEDINPFVLALTNPAQYAARYPDCDILHGDINGDGVVSFGDINAFIGLFDPQ